MTINPVIKAGQHQAAINAAVNAVYVPSADAVLKGISKGTDLLSMQDTFTQRVSSFQSFTNAKGLKGKVKAALNNYDASIAKFGDKASIKAGEGAYYVTKLTLNILTGTVISRSKVGQIVQEGIATLVGGLTRLIVKVAEYALRALPYLAVLAAMAFGGYKVGLALMALYGISKIAFAGVIVGAALCTGFVAQQLQIHKLAVNMRKLVQEQEELRKELQDASFSNQAKKLLGRLGQGVKNVGAALYNHKGKIATAVALGAGAYYYGYYGVPAVVTETLSKAGAYLASCFASPVVEKSATAKQVITTFRRATGRIVNKAAQFGLQQLMTEGSIGIASKEAAGLLLNGSRVFGPLLQTA